MFKGFLNFILLVTFFVNAGFHPPKERVLVDAENLKLSGAQDGQVGTVQVDLNGDGVNEMFYYTYLSDAPPGTCGSMDCMSKFAGGATLTIKFRIKSGRTIDIDYFCTSLSLLPGFHLGMRDILCGPKYILKWDGENYRMKGD